MTATSEEGDAEIPKVTVKGETVPVVEGDSNPGMLTVNADATPKTLTINSMTGHPLNWSPCK